MVRKEFCQGVVEVVVYVNVQIRVVFDQLFDHFLIVLYILHLRIVFLVEVMDLIRQKILTVGLVYVLIVWLVVPTQCTVVVYQAAARHIDVHLFLLEEMGLRGKALVDLDEGVVLGIGELEGISWI